MTLRLACLMTLFLPVAGFVPSVTQLRPEADRTMYGAGTNSCTQWTEARRGDSWFTAGQWVLGFVSAANQYSTVPPAKAEARDMARWVDDYCREHAESDVADAGKGLVELLLAGQQP